MIEKPTPLKGKLLKMKYHYSEEPQEYFGKEDIRSAVEWAKFLIRYHLKKGQGKETACVIIDKAFEDVMKGARK